MVHCVLRPVVVLICLLTTASLFGDLYRIRMLPIPDLHPGCTTEITFVVDHTRWPQQSPPDPDRALRGISFGVLLPSPVTYESHTFDGTHLKQKLGSDPWFGAVSPNGNGFGVAIVGDPYLQNMLPEGVSQILLKVTVKVPVGTNPQQLQVNFTDWGRPNDYLWMSMPIGDVVPYTQPQVLNITPGTCMAEPYFWAAAVGQLIDTEPATEEEEDEEADEDDSAEVVEEVYPDSADLDFPDPTEDELKPKWIGPDPTEKEADTKLPVVAAAMGTGGGGSAMAGTEVVPGIGVQPRENCNFVEPIIFEDDLPDEPTTVGPGMDYADLQLAIDAFMPASEAVYIRVEDGDYSTEDNHVIDVTQFPYGLAIYSLNGPAPDFPSTSGTALAYDDSDATPVFTFTQSGDAGGTIYLGVAIGEDPGDRRGFRITGGLAGAVSVDGLADETIDTEIIISGNIITGNRIEEAGDVIGGAGIRIEEASQVYVGYNEISLNELWNDDGLTEVDDILLGAGIYQSCADTWIGANVITENGFLSDDSDAGLCDQWVGAIRRGGGIYMQAGSAVICSNVIQSNNAVQGGGIYFAPISSDVQTMDFPFPSCDGSYNLGIAHIEDNDILENEAFEPDDSVDPNDPVECPAEPDTEWCIGYLGMGLCGDLISEDFAPPISYQIDEVRIWNNRIHHNSVSAPDGITFGDVAGCTIPASVLFEKDTDRGGGMFIYDILVWDYMLMPPTPDPQDCDDMTVQCSELSIIGNWVYENQADENGAGIWIYCPNVYFDSMVDPAEDSPFAQILHNTLTRNEGETGGVSEGVGIFVAEDSATVGNGNVVVDNDEAESDWFAECVQDAYSEPWTFCHMPDTVMAEDCGMFPLVGVDLFGDDCDTDPPGLDEADDVAPAILGPASEVVDTGDPDFGMAIRVLEDVEGDPYRIFDHPEAATASVIDRGGDELVDPIFMRGDADGNGAYGGLIDALFILAWAFADGEEPGCMDAVDADDSGIVAPIVDAFYLLTYSFLMGDVPPPPSPPDDCGLDPTADDVLCEEFPNSCD